MPWTLEPVDLEPVSPEDGYKSLALAILISFVADLQSPNPRRRQEARAAVHTGAGEIWTDLLDLTEAQKSRVLALLPELAH
jgi:hypothetical protein